MEQESAGREALLINEKDVIEFERQYFSQKPQIVSSVAQQVMAPIHPPFIGELIPGAKDLSKQDIVNHNREIMK